MSINQNIMEKKHVFPDIDEKPISKVRRNDHNYRQVYEYDKKIKREIANNNERRRMQSINVGFETLKQLLPVTMDVERLSKASILQFTAKYIQSLLARLTSLEKEISSYKNSLLNHKDKVMPSKPMTIIQEQNRKRRLNSCTDDLEALQNNNIDSSLDITIKENVSELTEENRLSPSCQVSEKIPGSLEHLVAAIEQVEGEKFYVSHTNSDVHSQIFKDDEQKPKDSLLKGNPSDDCTSKNQSFDNTNNNNHHNNNNSVMKPTISPYTEKIILAVSQHPHMFENKISKYSLTASRQPIYQIISNKRFSADSIGLLFNKTHSVGSNSGCQEGSDVSKRLPLSHKYLRKPPDFGLENNRHHHNHYTL